MRIILFLLLVISINCFSQVGSTIGVSVGSGGDPADSSCTVFTTRANLIALRGSSQLELGCHYIVTDHVQGQLVAGTQIHLHAIAINELNENVTVNTTYDNEGWTGIYDLDRGLVLELQDNRNNIARGINGTEVSQFDWGNTSYTNVLVDNATLTVNIGNTAQKQNLLIENGAVLNLTGFTGSAVGFHVNTNSTVNLSGANGAWSNLVVKDQSTLNAANYTGGSSFFHNEIIAASTVNISGSTQITALRQSVIQSSILTFSAITSSQSTITRLNIIGSFISKSNGALITNLDNLTMLNSTINQQTGQLTILNSSLDGNATLTTLTNNGITNITNSKLYGNSSITNASVDILSVQRCILSGASSRIQTFAGSVGQLSISDSEIFSQSFVVKNATSNGNLNIFSTRLHGTSSITHSGLSLTNINRGILEDNSNITIQASANGNVSVADVEMIGQSQIIKFTSSTAGTLTISTGTRIFSSSFIYQQAIGNLTVSQSEIIGSSGVNHISGDRNYSISRLSISEVARANLSGTGNLVTDIIQDCNIDSRGTINNSATGVAANQLLYSRIRGLSGTINITGTSTGQIVQRCEANDAALQFINMTIANAHDLHSANQGGSITFQNIGVVKNTSYFRTQSLGTINASNLTITGNMTRVEAINSGNINISGTAGTITQVLSEQGTININGGTSHININKRMGGVLTTGNFTSNNVQHHSPTSKTYTTNNLNRADYLGVVSSVPIL